MFTVILGILEAGLSLWQSKEKRKYIDQLLEIRTNYYAEINKPQSDRSDAVLDNLEFRLRLLGLAFSADVGSEVPSNK